MVAVVEDLAMTPGAWAEPFFGFLLKATALFQVQMETWSLRLESQNAQM